MTFLGIASQDGTGAMAEFIDRTGTDGFVQLADESGELWQRFGADIRSSFLFLDAETGQVQRTGYGEMTEERLRELAGALRDPAS